MPPIKLFFDECCSVRLPAKIREVYAEDFPNIQTKHLKELMAAGTADPKWLAVLDAEKDWIVITADRGNDPKTPKLPLICEKLGITFISLTPSIVHDGYSSQKQALLTLWPQIVKTRLLPGGTRVSLGYRMVNKGISKIHCLSIDHKPFDIWCHEHGIKDDSN